MADEVLGEAYDNFQQLGLKALVCIGGDGSLTIAQQFFEIGMPVGGIGLVVADEIQKRTGKETPAVVLGHLQRGGSPTAWDRHLCTRLGVSAVEQVVEQKFGVMVALTPSGIAPVELVDARDRIRTVPPDGEIVHVGRALGISFGGG